MGETVSIIAIALFTGMFKAMRDVFHSEQVWKVSIFKNNYNYWSWLGNTSRNKYKADTTKDRFLGSSTFFVVLTDGWHLSDLITIIGLFTIGHLTTNLDLFVISLITFFTSFNIFYSYVFTKKHISIGVWAVTTLVALILGAIGIQYIDYSFRYLLGLGLSIIGFVFIRLVLITIKWLYNKIFS